MRRDLSIWRAVRQGLRQHFQDVGINIPPELTPRPIPVARAEPPASEQVCQALARQIEGLGKTENSGED